MDQNVKTREEKDLRSEISDLKVEKGMATASRKRGVLALVTGSVVAALLAGCAVGPNYKEPKIAMPTQYRPATTQAVVEPPTVQWWKTFEDPRLDALILDASRGSLDVQAARARIRVAREQRFIANTGFWPTANARGSYQRTQIGGGTETFDGPNGDGRTVTFGGPIEDQYNVGFDAAWEIDVFGGVRRSVEAATAQEQSAVANLQNTLISLYAEVARNYIELRGFQREITIAEDNARAQRETLELTRTRFRAGLTSDLDVARAEAQVASTLSDIPNLQTQATAAAHRLGVLTGREPTALLDELAAPTRIPDPPPQVPVGIPSELLRRRPDVRAAERNLAAANANIGVFVADLFPRFTINGDVGYRSSQFGSLLNSNNLFWGFGPGVSWNIFNAGRTRGNIRAQEARTEEALANYKQTVLIALEDVQNALVAYQNDQARTRALAAAVESNQRAVSLAQQLYQRGLEDFLTVLQAQLNLFVAQDQLVRSYTAVSTDVVRLHKALGGGWEEMPRGATESFPVPTTQRIPWITQNMNLPTTQPGKSPVDVIEPAPRPNRNANAPLAPTPGAGAGPGGAPARTPNVPGAGVPGSPATRPGR
ncbi:MAG TPA: efflux transporter outer membrane subunit [Tepidisphaeraceae bacterium]|jgi:NodT family efflux transporter outer membrane factor (OMF) lipoprotein